MIQPFTKLITCSAFLAAMFTAGAKTNEEVSGEILEMFREEQKALADFGASLKDPAIARAYEEHKARVLKNHPPVFYDLAVKEQWASEPGCPDFVRRLVEMRTAITERVKKIIAENGWPRRSSFGDEAAAAIFFLVGHADTSNAWRRTLLGIMLEVFQEDRVNPRLYAHMVDRIETLDDKPQIFGSVMGPGKTPGSAELYRPVLDSLEAVEKRRAQIGLPPIEADLERFRKGARIGPYMTPITKEWTMAEVYGLPR